MRSEVVPVPLILPPRVLKESHTISSRYDRLLPAEVMVSGARMHQDLILCINHIIQFSNSPDTMSFYRTELNRFLNWAWMIKQKSICEMRREDVIQYIEFCIFPPASWVSDKTTYAFIESANSALNPNPEWRPFLSQDMQGSTQGTITTVFSRLSAFYTTLCSDSQTDHNPVRAIRQKSKYKKKGLDKKTPKVITKEQINNCITVCEDLSDAAVDAESSKEFMHAERALFAFSIALGMYLRVSELVWDNNSSPVHGDFFKDADGHWWFRTIGKGSQERVITVSDDVLSALVRYRRILDLTDLPSPSDKTPLIMSLGNGTWDDEKDWFKKLVPITDTAIMWRLFKKIFSLARSKMILDGKSDDAFELLCASCHWLRHTGISADAQIRPLEHVRDDAGHQSSQTTLSYVNATNRDRALSKQ